MAKEKVASKNRTNQEKISVPIIQEHHSELIREIGESGDITYKHPRGMAVDVSTTVSFWDIRVRYMGMLRETIKSLEDDIYCSGLGVAVEQLVNFADQRLEEVERLLDEHVGKLEFHQVDRSEIYGGHCIIGLTVSRE